MSAHEQQVDFLLARCKALEIENKRLNEEIKKAKSTALSLTLSDPNFDKPLSEIILLKNHEQTTAITYTKLKS